MSNGAGNYTPPDGHQRPLQVEHDINRLFAMTFGTDHGEKVLNYLKNITLNEVLPIHQIDKDRLAYREGMRFLVAVISQRIGLGNDDKPVVPMNGEVRHVD